MHGRELWQSDGTAAGTRLLQELEPGPTSSSPTELTVADTYVLFAATSGRASPDLWQLPRVAVAQPTPTAAPTQTATVMPTATPTPR